MTVATDIVRRPDRPTFADNVRTFLRARESSAAARRVAKLIARHRPDIVHVHNFFPELTPSVHRVAAQAGAAVVQTLHNYRLFCANATFERDFKPCELCVSDGRRNAIGYSCYRNSRIASAAVVAMQRRAIDDGMLVDNVDRFIALTRFARDKFVESGLPADRVAIKPNALGSGPRATGEARRGILFASRLAHEKGLEVLIEAWRELPEVPLTILGEGPMRDKLEAQAPANVAFKGHVDSGSVLKHMQAAQALILPSLWYEGFPMALVEAFSCSLPVLASDIGSLAEIVDPGRTGLLFPPNDAERMANTIRAFLASPEQAARMGRQARHEFETQYCPTQNLPRLLEIYDEALKRRAERLSSTPAQ